MAIEIRVSRRADGVTLSVLGESGPNPGTVVVGPIVIDDQGGMNSEDPGAGGAAINPDPGPGGAAISPDPGPGGSAPVHPNPRRRDVAISPDPGPGFAAINPDPGPGFAAINPDPGPGFAAINPDPGPGFAAMNRDAGPGGAAINPDPGPGGAAINPDPGPGGVAISPDPGPGGGFGSGGLVVIGPIVISGTCAGTAPAPVPGTFPLEHQEKAYWCWAAVAEAVKKYFSPGTSLTQCSLAKKVLVATAHLDSSTDCCEPDSRCNSPAKLQDALAITHNLGSIQPPLAWDDIKAQLSYAVPRPVCVRIEWDDHAGAHFIVIYGYREFTSGVRQVLVADPLFTAGTAAYVLYEDVLNFYDQFGYWSYTFLVTP